MNSATSIELRPVGLKEDRIPYARSGQPKAMAVACQYALTTSMVGLCTLTAVVSAPILNQENDMMLYLFVAYIAANKFGLGPALWACFLSIGCFDYFVAAPLFQIDRFIGQHIVALVLMFVLVSVASERTSRIRQYAARLEDRVEERTRELAQSNQDLLEEIAKRRETEEALRKSLDEIVRSNNALQQFARIASHDMQEPLKVIQGYTALLRSRYAGRLDSNADEFIGYIFDGAERMEGLIKGVLEHATINTSVKPFLPVDMNKCFEEACANLEQSIAEKKALVSAEPLPVVMADKLQMTRLLQNLIGNALKFVKDDATPRIAVSAVRRDGILEFQVCDNGIGIENQYLDKIFGMFRRLHSADEYPGTGLGLAICKAIVDHHNGAIRVESTPGQGSTFSFTIPDCR